LESDSDGRAICASCDPPASQVYWSQLNQATAAVYIAQRPLFSVHFLSPTLTALTDLLLHLSTIQGPLPNPSGLHTLQHMDLTFNQLTVPSIALHPLAPFQYIHLANNKLYGPLLSALAELCLVQHVLTCPTGLLPPTSSLLLLSRLRSLFFLLAHLFIGSNFTWQLVE